MKAAFGFEESRPLVLRVFRGSRRHGGELSPDCRREHACARAGISLLVFQPARPK